MDSIPDWIGRADRIWLYVTSDCGSLSVRSGQQAEVAFLSEGRMADAVCSLL